MPVEFWDWYSFKMLFGDTSSARVLQFLSLHSTIGCTLKEFTAPRVQAEEPRDAVQKALEELCAKGILDRQQKANQWVYRESAGFKERVRKA